MSCTLADCMPSIDVIATCSKPHTTARWNKNIPRHFKRLFQKILIPCTRVESMDMRRNSSTVDLQWEHVLENFLCCCLHRTITGDESSQHEGWVKLRKCALQHRKEEEEANLRFSRCVLGFNGIEWSGERIKIQLLSNGWRKWKSFSLFWDKEQFFAFNGV